MSKNIPSELKGWDEIVELAGGDNTPSQGKAKAKASQKEVLAMVNLGQSILSMQKVVGTRLEALTQHLEESTNASDKVSKRTFWLTIVLVIATVVQACAAVIAVKIAATK
jgi:hypothetical protein